MDPGVFSSITSVKFLPYTKEEIELFSVKEIKNSQMINKNTRELEPNSVYDPELGPTEPNEVCPVCKQNHWSCPGHFGHIKLSTPVYHPLYVKKLAKLLSSVCTECAHFRIQDSLVSNVVNSLRLIKRGQVLNPFDVFNVDNLSAEENEKNQKDVNRLIKSLNVVEPNSYTVEARTSIIKEFFTRASSYKMKCFNCNHSNRKINFHDHSFSFYQSTSDEDSVYIPIDKVRSLLQKFCESNHRFFREVFNNSSFDMFFIENVAVTPSKFRPMSFLMDAANPHPTSSSFSRIVEKNRLYDEARESKESASDPEILKKALRELQESVNVLIDSKKSTSNKALPHGIRQILEKKEGVFRKNLMGKRVNFSARSVIAPDPYVATDEVGVPEIFAKTLSYPERVSEYNKDRLSQMIINGPDKYPGANYVVDCNGETIQLKKTKLRDRKSLAQSIYNQPDGPYTWTVGRHVINGDYVLINRQPSLHRVSILGMKTKILPNQRTIRMHYSNCSSFNADFDGDEINLHLPQNEISRAEVNILSLSSRHYITPTAGSPIRGLIQDHVGSGVILTLKNRFFTASEYQELVFSAFGGEVNKRIRMLTPAIIKPVPLYTGKQVISTLIINLSGDIETSFELESPSKITTVLCRTCPEETVVRIVDGHLVTGLIDKNQFGASRYGLVHTIYELCGSDMASNFLTMLTRLFTFYVQTHGFSCGVHDILITKDGEALRDEMRENISKVSKQVTREFIKEFGKAEDKSLSLKQRLWKLICNPQLKTRYDHIMMGKLNSASTSVINNIFPTKLIKLFPANHMVMMTTSGAKGSNVNSTQISVLLGQQALEGKRVPLMSSGKSLPSYKFMELAPEAGGFVSSRFLTGLRPQEYFFHAMGGREGLTDTAVKTANTGYLQRCIIKNTEGIRSSYDGTVRDSDDTIIQFLYGEDGIDPMNNKYLSKFDFIEDNIDSYLKKLNTGQIIEKANWDLAQRLIDNYSIENVENLQEEYPPHIFVGSVSQKWLNDLNRYCEKRLNDTVNPLDAEDIRKLRSVAIFNYFNCLVQPGEVVGVIAAEAIGEPATQMTLNTFHLAGYGGTNVTLGIPRLREILVVATRTPKTPTMTLPLTTTMKDEADRYVRSFRRIPLREFVKSYTVQEFFDMEGNGSRKIEIELTLSHETFEKENLDIESYVTQTRNKFSRSLKRRINAVLRESKDNSIITDAENDEVSHVNTLSEKQIQKEEEMGADLEKVQSRKSEKKSYEADKVSEVDGKDTIKNEEDPVMEGLSSNINQERFSIQFSFLIPNVSVKMLFKSIIDSLLEEVMVKEVSNVVRASLMDNKDGSFSILTEGANFDEIINRKGIDITRFYTNDIGIILEKYGIEAARSAIIKEVMEVFRSYSIDIDLRHLTLIADYLTVSGDWLGLSRHSMKKCPSPLQQMSFETTTSFLTQLSLHGGLDNMSSPSSALSTGNLVKFGSGICDILVPFEQ